ncbi:MAG: hypothetical protein JNJ40_09760 [Bacteroidia bacterium]|nr:hypothetical protein [Bacteroidia bacterium]
MITIIAINFILLACNNSNPPVDQKPLTTVDSMEASLPVADNVDPDAKFDFANTSLPVDYNDMVSAKFSNDSTDDRFIVFIPQGNINKTKTALRILTKNGAQVYEHIFNTTELINEYDIVAFKSDKEMADYIVKKADALLHKGIVDLDKLGEEDYLAVASKEQFTNYDLFLDMKAKGRRLLNYTLNLENHYYLGYSARDKKVVTIIECC